MGSSPPSETVDSGDARIDVRVVAPFPSVRRGLAAMLAEFPDLEPRMGAEIPGEEPPDVLVAYVSSGSAGNDLVDVPEPDLPLVLIVEGMLTELPEISERPIALLPAEVDASALHAAVLAVYRGLAVVDPTYAAGAGIVWRQPHAQPAEVADQLTSRESEVLNLVARGWPNKTIASELGISEHTVKFHVGSILGKLGAESRTEAVTIATRRGLVVI